MKMDCGIWYDKSDDRLATFQHFFSDAEGCLDAQDQRTALVALIFSYRCSSDKQQYTALWLAF